MLISLSLYLSLSISLSLYIYIYIHTYKSYVYRARLQRGFPLHRRLELVPALGGTTCHLFYALFLVSRITIIHHIVRHF